VSQGGYNTSPYRKVVGEGNGRFGLGQAATRDGGAPSITVGRKILDKTINLVNNIEIGYY
jgi:hypothetical protein